MLLVSDSLIGVSSIHSILLEYNCLLNRISNSELNETRAHRTFQSPCSKLRIKRNQNFTGRLQAHRTFWSLHSKLRIKWNHNAEPSRAHAANSELNGARTSLEGSRLTEPSGVCTENSELNGIIRQNLPESMQQTLN